LQAYAAAGTVNQNYANILLMLLRLRQACDHPRLVKDIDSDPVGKDSVEMAKRLPREMQINLFNCLDSTSICHICNVSKIQIRYFLLFVLCYECDGTLDPFGYILYKLWCFVPLLCTF